MKPADVSAAEYFSTLTAGDVEAFGGLEDALIEFLDYVRRNQNPEVH